MSLAQTDLQDFSSEKNRSGKKDEESLSYDKDEVPRTKLQKEYLLDCEARLSSRTVENYKASLNEFQNFLCDKTIEEASKLDVRKFLNELKKNGRARSTISLRLSDIRSFLDYARECHDVETPTLRRINVGNYPKSKWEGSGRDPLTRGEVRKLIETPETLRNTLIIAFLYYLGLRAGGLVRLKLEDLKRKDRLVDVVEKGDKPRTVPYPNRLDRPINRWLREERKGYASSERSSYFFPSKHGDRLSTNSVYDIVHNIAVEAGVQEAVGEKGNGDKIYKVKPHVLRHSFATHALEDGVPLKHIEQIMGHEDVKTTMGYTGKSGVFDTYRENFKGV
ncbi:hypothetical protein AKJ51_00140 [candidate division MSBL1 archaeon SCGC-AAA382A20]|uniref:Integrase n=1 Tax=candidate division MSBL1 archaeon SCGC-AAA382A20 TaxID=1698280 RepID=A0A133VMW3_9EURY|nr:hypothetical protein AKJ51_00140 [candidate division MSBL1 archaeon SCGC-AAA382A20]